MKKIIVGNWKSNEKLDMLQDIKTDNENLELCIAVPYLYISEVKQKYGSFFEVAAQDCSRYGEGAYTGETPASLIKKCGASYVILGHLERRKYFEEDSTVLSEKFSQALNNGLRVIYCIGENKREREDESYLKVLYNQFFSVVGKDISVDISYEPTYSIGTDYSPAVEDVEEVVKNISKWANGIGVKGRILYGGSVSEKTIEQFSKIEGLNGFLIGRKSQTHEFQELIRKFEDVIGK